MKSQCLVQGSCQGESVCDVDKWSAPVIVRCQELARMSQFPVFSYHLLGNLAVLAKWLKGSFITLRPLLQYTVLL